mmetsp:Transcript_67566/g.187358  ORF Transcript_67566/g.187358 Transcript_67566/m.187358 type:complete len:265 (-) Transcript_67566:18-812(-)
MSGMKRPWTCLEMTMASAHWQSASSASPKRLGREPVMPSTLCSTRRLHSTKSQRTAAKASSWTSSKSARFSGAFAGREARYVANLDLAPKARSRNSPAASATSRAVEGSCGLPSKLEATRSITSWSTVASESTRRSGTCASRVPAAVSQVAASPRISALPGYLKLAAWMQPTSPPELRKCVLSFFSDCASLQDHLCHKAASTSRRPPIVKDRRLRPSWPLLPAFVALPPEAFRPCGCAFRPMAEAGPRCRVWWEGLGSTSNKGT